MPNASTTTGGSVKRTASSPPTSSSSSSSLLVVDVAVAFTFAIASGDVGVGFTADDDAAVANDHVNADANDNCFNVAAFA